MLAQAGDTLAFPFRYIVVQDGFTAMQGCLGWAASAHDADNCAHIADSVEPRVSPWTSGVSRYVADLGQR